MGTSHFDSDVYGFDGTEVIRGFATVSATALQGTTLTGVTLHSTGAIAANTSVVATTFVKTTTMLRLGTSQYIFFGTAPTEASVVADATALSTSKTNVMGSMYLSKASTVALWVFDGALTATRVKQY
jgi:hypothetical protein